MILLGHESEASASMAQQHTREMRLAPDKQVLKHQDRVGKRTKRVSCLTFGISQRVLVGCGRTVRRKMWRLVGSPRKKMQLY